MLGLGGNRRLEIRAHVRVWQQRPGEFRPKTDRRANVFKQIIRLEAWTAPAATEPQTAPTELLNTLVAGPPSTQEPARSDSMDTLRDISVRFFKLTLSQKSAIAGKLNLLEEEDANQPDFERFRRVFVRARDRGLVTDLDREVSETAGRRP